MEQLGRTLIVAAIILALVMFGAVYAYNTLSPEARAISEALLPDYITARLIVLYCGAIGIGLTFLAFGTRTFAWALDHLIKALVVLSDNGVIPQILFLGRFLSPAETHGHERELDATFGGELRRAGGTGGTITAIRKPDPNEARQLPAQTTIAPLRAEDVVDVDPRQRPHTILIGESGSGKSFATFLMLAMLCRQYKCEVLILEREAVDWNYNSAVQTVDGYLEALRAVEAERLRRAEMLRAADVKHISDLRNPPPYLVVVVEEAESVQVEFRKTRSKAEASEYEALLGNLARLSRKEGILMFITTQTGTSGVFDVPTRKQFGNRYFFRSEPQVGDSWGIPRDFVLPQLPSGTAYSIRHGGLVEFPLVPRPSLPLSNLYREPGILALPADAEADGVGANDMPDSPHVYRRNGDGIPASPAVAYAAQTQARSAPRYPGVTYQAGDNVLTDYDEARHRRLWERFSTIGGSLKAAQRYIPPEGFAEGYDGGTDFYLVRTVRDLGSAGRLPWQNGNGGGA